MTPVLSANVAALPQHSPLRYPGGKTSLAPAVRLWLQDCRPDVLVEPFAGGASTSLLALSEGLVPRVVLRELDPDVASFWRVVFSPESEALAVLAEGFVPTPSSVASLLRSSPRDDLGRAWRLLVHNRTSRGGVVAPRAGLVRAGERGRGLSSRWYPDTLAGRIRAAALLAPRVSFAEGDALDLLRSDLGPSCAAFVDPPYSASTSSAGRRLYRHWDVDHELLVERCSAQSGSVLLTYDDVPEVRSLAAAHLLEVVPVPLGSAQGVVKQELLLGRDLSWAR